MATPERQPGERIELVMLDLSLLRIPRYQRPEPDKRVDAIYEAWDDLACGALHVSYRDGAYWVIDGQTRAAAARRRGKTHLPALVCHGITEAREAGLFLRANRDRLQVSAIARHRCEALAQEERALAIDEVLAEFGYQIGRATDLHYEVAAELDPIFAVEACEKVWGDGGSELLYRTLYIIDHCFRADTGRHRGSVVKGLGYFLTRDTWGADDEKIIARLSRLESTMKLDEIAAHWQQVMKKRSSATAPIYMAKAVASYVYPREGDAWKPGTP